jgi:hypothetical protein
MYIYQNPVKAGICKHPADYEWCSRKQLGSGGIVDEDDLFSYIPADVIMKLEVTEVECETLEPKIISSKAISDADAIKQIKSISRAESMTAFLSLDRKMQALTYIELKKQGVSVRQFARLSGMSKNIVERMAQQV